jgi:glycosyltransferase involved in cell wall biosynthesis
LSVGGSRTDFRVSILGPAPPDRGGIAHQTRLLAEAFGECLGKYFSYSRPYPRFLNPRRFDDLPEGGEAVATRILDWALPGSWRRAGRAAVESGDALLAPWWTAFWAVPLAAAFREARRRDPRFRCVLLCHHVFDHESAAWKRSLAWTAFASADAVIAQSEADRETIVARFPRLQIRVLPHPIEARAPAHRSAARRRLGVERPLVLFLGLVRPYKGLDVLREAAPRIRQRTGATVAVVGEVFADSQEEMRRWRRVADPEAIRFVDRYVSEREMDEWLAACDVVVCPYRKNSGSGIAARAIAARRPIVASRLSGFLPFVSEETGALVSEGDPERLAEAVIRVLEKGADSFTAALDDVADRHAWPAYARAALEFIESL